MWIMRSSSSRVRSSCSISRQVSLNNWAASSLASETLLVPGGLLVVAVVAFSSAMVVSIPSVSR